ncbi:MAG: trypsin-like peptidase domain-containing protein [Bacillota bacterium]
MTYFYGQPPRRTGRASIAGYFLSAVAGGIIGALLMAYLVPGVIAQRMGWSRELPRFQFPDLPPVTTTAADYPVVMVAETLGPAVVGVVNRAVVGQDFRGRQLLETRTGSGVLISSNGYIITNHHVIANTSQLTVIMADGSSFSAEIVGSDPPVDLAVIKIPVDHVPYARLGDSDALRVGEPAIAIGNPLGLEFRHSVTAGVISGIDRILQVGEEFIRLVQTDAVINPGNSGGPLANSSGEVIGINTLKIDLPRVEGMGFAIPSNTVRRIVEELISDGRVRRPWLGVKILDRATIQQYRIEVRVQFDRGVYVDAVVTGSPAARAGLSVGDIIVEIGKRRVDDIGSLQVALREHRVGETVAVKIIRNGQTQTVEITLGEVPSS